MPSLCANTVTGCALCGGLYDQGSMQYPVDCDCCATYADCATNYTCLTTSAGNRCRPNQEAPNGVCVTDEDCVSASLCRVPRCNTTMHQCYFKNVECEQTESACIARQECAPETGLCKRVPNTCPPGNACQALFSCIEVDGEAVCTYQDIIPIPPFGDCIIEHCDPETGWSYIPRPCPSGRTCVQSQGCQMDCVSNSTCDYLDDAFACIVGACVDGVCMARTTCSDDDRCSAGFCVNAGCGAFKLCPTGSIVNTAAPPACPCVCDAPTCAQRAAPDLCHYYGCGTAVNGSSICELKEKTCPAPTGCSTTPVCELLTGECGPSFPLCNTSPLACPQAEVCGVDNVCVEVNSTTCPNCPNTTAADCQGGEIVYVFVCDDGDPCTADRVDPDTGGCINLRDPNCCSRNSECLSGACDLTNNLCLSPISSCLGSGSCAPQDPCLADYMCVNGACVWTAYPPNQRPTCYANICGEGVPDDSFCNDFDFLTVDVCSDTLCPDSPNHCAHCTFVNAPPGLATYVTFVDYDDCTCS
jgi:hypothetical protein